MNWFEKHLSLALLCYLIVWIGIIFAFAGRLPALAATGIVGEILFLFLAAWNLRRKGQSMWFLVAVFFLLWIIFLIPNKNVVKATLEYEYPDEPDTGGDTPDD